jgi:hypothetical protein
MWHVHVCARLEHRLEHRLELHSWQVLLEPLFGHAESGVDRGGFKALQKRVRRVIELELDRFVRLAAGLVLVAIDAKRATQRFFGPTELKGDRRAAAVVCHVDVLAPELAGGRLVAISELCKVEGIVRHGGRFAWHGVLLCQTTAWRALRVLGCAHTSMDAR